MNNHEDVSLEPSEALEALQRAIDGLQQEINILKKTSAESEDYLLQTLRDYQNRAKELVAAVNQNRLEYRVGYQEILEVLTQLPLQYGTFIRENEDGTVDLETQRGRVRAAISEEERKKISFAGQRVILTPATQVSPGGNVLRVLEEHNEIGEEVSVDEVIDENLVRVVTRLEEKTIVFIGGNLKAEELSLGDKLLYDRRTGFVFRKLPHKETSDLMLEEIPDITYTQIGGQEVALQKLQQVIEYPFLYPEFFAKYKLKKGKHPLLFGPPGCGKTMGLKAVAHSMQEKLGKKVILLVVRGPEFLTMWVGETERKIREPFELAKLKAREGIFIIMLFDEIDTTFPARGTYTGSAGVHENSVAQFSTMLDGVEEFSNIVVVGSTNRPDILDGALTRPGRLDPLIKFPRPDREGVDQIFGIYLEPLVDLVHQKYVDPFHPDWQQRYERFGQDKLRVVREYFIANALALIFAEKKVFDEEASAFSQMQNLEKQKVLMIEFTDTRDRRTFYMKDLISGAIITDIVERTKMKAILAEIAGQEGGLRVSFLLESIEEIFRESEALPNRTDPTSWARILDLSVTRPFRIIEAEKREEEPAPRKGRTTA